MNTSTVARISAASALSLLSVKKDGKIVGDTN